MQSIITPIFAPQTTPAAPAPTPGTPPVAQNAPGSSASAPSNLDPAIVALMHGIKTNEGANGNYDATGDNGTAAGIAMWSNENAQGVPQPLASGAIPANFQGMAKQYGLDPTDFSAANQNQVLYASLAADKQAGLSPEQILSKWNSGNPNAYLTNPVEKSGVSATGTQNVAAYVKNGMSAAQAYAAAQKANASWNSYTNPSGASNVGTGAAPSGGDTVLGNDISTGNWGGAIVQGGKDLLNFAFPIIGDAMNDISGNNQKSILQQVGDAGLSALWFIPGLGEGAGLGAHILEGAALGYGAGTLSGLSQGKDIISALTPNASNLIGAATGGVAGGVLSKLSDVLGKNVTQEGALQAVQDNLDSALRGTKSGVQLLDDSKAAGFNPSKLIAQAGAIPDIVDGKFSTAGASQLMEGRLNQLGQLRATALDSLPATQSLDDLAAAAKKSILTPAANATPEEISIVNQRAMSGETGKMSSRIDSVVQQIKSDAGLTADANGVMPDMQLKPSQVEAMKEAQAGASKIYKGVGNIGDANGSSLLADQARSSIEDMATKSGFPGMKEYNQYMAQHYNALEALDKLNGQVVKGGRLGNILRGHTIAGVSALGANAMGGGFLGTLAAAATGEGVNNILSKVMGDTSFTNPLRDAILNKISEENPDIVSKLQTFAGQSGKVAPLLTPKAPSGALGAISNFGTKLAARGGATIGTLSQ